ncbi:unnamed protein product [Paramecium sonneborni]|uniref:Uncharacterized protein n=1 Tax=Paramecium sonneborni TaxID=65129 RepID=A0A8S1L9B1_9CILI|nr:unnamed protein product [Paramecium sonneborni]CAD8064442.1 unnamed protein product [Paramecium sonneborni]
MGCHCTKTKESLQSQFKEPQILIFQNEPQNLTQPTSDYRIEDYDQNKPPKLCLISNSNRGIKKTHQNRREIGGKKEIFSQLYIRPYQKK